MFTNKIKFIFFIILFLAHSFSCKKENIGLAEILSNGKGKWIVEWITTYDESPSGKYIPTSHLKNLGTFTFNSNGTGIYHFINPVEFNWYLNGDLCYFMFDKLQIKDQQSPILMYFTENYFLSSYNVFSTNFSTCKFTHIQTGSRAGDFFRKMEFTITKEK